MESTRFGASQICRSNRNFSFCRKALVKVNHQDCLFKGGFNDKLAYKFLILDMSLLENS